MGFLTAPFYFPLPGVTIEEIDPWEEAGETWRRLKVNFPSQSRCTPLKVELLFSIELNNKEKEIWN
jgi:hypothetical protein